MYYDKTLTSGFYNIYSFMKLKGFSDLAVFLRHYKVLFNYDANKKVFFNIQNGVNS